MPFLFSCSTVTLLYGLCELNYARVTIGDRNPCNFHSKPFGEPRLSENVGRIARARLCVCIFSSVSDNATASRRFDAQWEPPRAFNPRFHGRPRRARVLFFRNSFICRSSPRGHRVSPRGHSFDSNGTNTQNTTASKTPERVKTITS